MPAATTTPSGDASRVCKRFVSTYKQVATPLANGWPNWSPVLQPVCKLDLFAGWLAFASYKHLTRAVV